MYGSIIFKDSILQLDHVVEGRAHNLPKQRVLVIQLGGFTHSEEKLEIKKMSKVNEIKLVYFRDQ